MIYRVFATVCFLFMSMWVISQEDWSWETLEADGEPTARHEAAFIAFKDKLYLIGGRRINPTSVYDIKTNSWSEKAASPIELHHFQPVVVKNEIFLMGAMTGPWPEEKPLERIIKYLPLSDKFVYGKRIPDERRRGGAGVAYHNGKIYMVGGIINGHMNGYKPWFDEYNPSTGEWKVLPDAPNARDHSQAIVVNNKLYTFGGRQSSRATGQDMHLTVEYGNVYDFDTGEWEEVTGDLALPTQRAGNSVIAWNNEVIVVGGESMSQKQAHDQVEAYNTRTKRWRSWPSLNRGRHGSGLAIVGEYMYTASGCGNRGGKPELTSIERIKLPAIEPSFVPVYQQFHKVEIDFESVMSSESDPVNPFKERDLTFRFKHADTSYVVKGFFAADGNAAETSADKGDIWRVRFSPDRIGEWTYEGSFRNGMPAPSGKFLVTRSDKEFPDLRAVGRLGVSNGYFKSEQRYWIKAGANSPENLLAYKDFDGTYRMFAEAREGEAAASTEIHSFEPHLRDFREGDPTWQNGKGKEILGAMNYLASRGMNSVYFLVMNIGGDGKDVWPYADPTDFTRFDVSKLDQWEILFSHMNKLGIVCHVVLQETENEKMLDGGDTGEMRKLYLRELIARFGHHPGLIWNLGEENGPASWSPDAQNTEQRKAMIDFLTENDPYNHPILLHTHSTDPERIDVLKEIVGFERLDGLSLQVNNRQSAPGVVMEWQDKSAAVGNKWLITMDEIGKWHTAVTPDIDYPTHPSLRRYALWGTLLSGAAGVEWYFGAKYPHNDLTSEDWRQRDGLWRITEHARSFFDNELPYWEMTPINDLVSVDSSYCLTKPGEIYAIYLPIAEKASLDLSGTEGEFEVLWYDVLMGGEFQKGSVESVSGGANVLIGEIGDSNCCVPTEKAKKADLS